MPGMSQTQERNVLDHWFSVAATTPPATWYVGLLNVMPASDSAAGTEVSGTAYARVAVTNNATNFPAATGGGPASKANGTAVTFPAPTGNWTTAAGFGLWDAASGGTLRFFAAFSSSKTINNGDPAPSFAIGALVVTLD